MSMDLEAAGALAVAGAAAHEIDKGLGASPLKGAHPARCLNCDTALTGEFCHACGQRAHVHKSLLHLGHEVLHGILHFDAVCWRTLPMLVLHPGKLTRAYIDGQRTRYVSPLALFLFMIFLMFFVASLTSGKTNINLSTAPQAVASVRAEIGQAMDKVKAEAAEADAALARAKAQGGDVAHAQVMVDQAQAEMARLDKALGMLGTTGAAQAGGGISVGKFTADTPWPAVNRALSEAARNPQLTLYKLKGKGSQLSFLLVPISLPFLWVMFFWRRGATMYDHAVFSLYSLSFMSLMFVAVFLLGFAGASSVVPVVVCLAPPLHMFVQLRGTYCLTGMQALWRTFALLCAAAIVFTVYLLLILIMTVSG